MAILINFSKTICGLLIDVAQIVMMTFVNAFKDIAAGHLVTNLGLKEVMTLAKGSAEIGFWAIVGAYVLGLIYVLISLVVVITMLAMLVMRIVMIWIYIVLSPAAYLMSAFPGGQKYASQWWSEFIKNLIVGPVLAFFIWLSFVSLQSLEIKKDFKITNDNTEKIAEDMNVTNTATSSSMGATEASTPDVFIRFIIAIGMLIGGLKISQEIGGAAGGMAGKGMAAIQKGQAWTGKMAFNKGKNAVNWTGRQLDVAQMKAQKGIALGLGSKNYKPKSLNTKFIKEGWQRSRDEKMEKYKSLYGGASGNWHDSFNKYSDIRQYGSIRKGLNKQAADNETATELEAENAILQRRKAYIGLSGTEYNEKMDELERQVDEIIKEYIAKAPKKFKTDVEKRKWAEEQYGKDIHYLDSEAGYSDEVKKETLDKAINSNQQRAQKLRDVRWQVGGKFGAGFNKGYRFESVYGRSGDKENQKKEESAMSARTGEDNFALISELIKASSEKDATKIACALKLLAKNNDLNEALKDNRIANIMTANNGILETMSKNGSFGKDANTPQAIQALKSDYSVNRVTPAYLQALVQGMFAKAGANSDLAARYANDIGNVSFANGNTLAYAMAEGNASSGNYEFNSLDYKNGKLDTNNERKAISTGKWNNLESQAKMRAIHPDSLISENADGNATGITEDGISLLRNLNAHDLSQIDRMRVDAIKKIGNSRQAMRDLIKLVAQLESEGNKNQAENVKFFATYIEQKKGGRGIKGRDDVLGKDGTPNFDKLKENYA